MTSLAVLAADLGASSGKIARVSFDGNRILAEEERGIANRPAQIFQHSYWNVFSLYTDMLSAFAELSTPEVRSVGIDTWGASFGLIGKNGMLTEPIYHYRDVRTKTALEEIYQSVTAREIFWETGCQPNRNYSLAHLFVTARHAPEQMNRAEQLLFLPDLFNYFLSGERCSELSFAGTSALLNASLDGWNRGLLQRLDIPTHILGKLVPPGSIRGHVLPGVSAQSNLPTAAKVISACSHDTAAAVSAIPDFNENAVYVGCGTNINMGIRSEAPIITEDAYRSGLKNTGAMFGRNLLYKDFNAFWLLNRLRQEWQLQNKQYSFSELFDLARQHMHEARLLDVEDECFNNTSESISQLLRHSLLGSEEPLTEENDGRLLASIFYSIAYKICDTIRSLEQASGRQIQKIYIINGGARNTLLNQLVADMSGKPVYAGLFNASLLGNSLSQLYALGYIASEEEMNAVCRRSFQLDLYLPQA